MKTIIYYKEAPNGGRIKIDNFGNKSASFNQKNSPERWAESEKFIAEGAVLEPEVTEVEQAAKESKEAADAIQAQKDLCQKYLDETDYKLLSDFEYQDDVPALKILRIEWKRIRKSDQIETVSVKPFKED